jgi:hypothetical protein
MIDTAYIREKVNMLAQTTLMGDLVEVTTGLLDEIENGDYWMGRAKEFMENGHCPVCYGDDEGGHTDDCEWGRCERAGADADVENRLLKDENERLRVERSEANTYALAAADEILRRQAEAAVMWHIINKTQQWALAEERFGPLFAELIESVLFVDIPSTGQAVTDRLQQAEAAVSVVRELRHAEKSRGWRVRNQLRARLDKMLADLAIWPESCEVCNCLDGDTVVCGPECPHFEDQPGVPI